MITGLVIVVLLMTALLGTMVAVLLRSFRRFDVQKRNLAAGEERFRAVVETAHDCVICGDAGGNITYANGAVEATFGYAPGELHAQSLTMLMPERFREAHRAGMARFQSTGEARVIGTTTELVGRRKDGTEFPLEVSLASWDSSGDLFYTGVIRDVTQRKAREAEALRLMDALRESEGRAFQFLASLPVGVFVINAEGRPVYSNDAAISMLGKGLVPGATSDTLAQIYDAVVVGTDEPYPAARMPIVRALNGFESLVEDMEIVRPSGRLQLEVRGSPILDVDGQIAFALAAFTNVTDNRAAEAEVVKRAHDLAASNKELEQFAYVASHDLQEPLRMVASYMTLLERKYAGQLDADAQEFIHYAVDGATRMQTLINDLLVYSRAGRQDREPREVDVGLVADKALVNLQSAITERRATITRDPLPVVMGDEPQLIQVFQNLISNALKFCDKGCPVIHIGAHRDNGLWTISVRDNGIGVAPEHADRIFLMFERLNKRSDYAGTGIGLAICQKIVEKHGGAIRVVSQPGQGTTFAFTLPAVDT